MIKTHMKTVFWDEDSLWANHSCLVHTKPRVSADLESRHSLHQHNANKSYNLGLSNPILKIMWKPMHSHSVDILQPFKQTKMFEIIYFRVTSSRDSANSLPNISAIEGSYKRKRAHATARARITCPPSTPFGSAVWKGLMAREPPTGRAQHAPGVSERMLYCTGSHGRDCRQTQTLGIFNRRSLTPFQVSSLGPCWHEVRK